MTESRLEYHRAVWKRKPFLQALYKEWFSWITSELIPGLTIEIGSGPGFFKQYYSNCITTDVIFCPWLDIVVNAEQMPFTNESVANIVMIDVLHHLAAPMIFFEEASRILRLHGHIIIIDVQITPFSYLIYKLFHHEPVDFSWRPDCPGQCLSSDDKQPFDSNQAITTLLFGAFRDKMNRQFPELEVVTYKRFNILTYPLSGGFEHNGLLRQWNFNFFQKFDRLLSPLVRLLSFRNFIVIKKKTASYQ